MANSISFYSKWSPRLLSVLRIVAALLLMQHGAQKLFGVPAAPPPPPQQQVVQQTGQQQAQQQPQQQQAEQQPRRTPPLMLVAGVLEFFGGLLCLVGLFTRPVAFILSGMLAVAYFMVHAPQGFWPVLNKGELAALYSFVFLFLAAAGGGSWSLDNLWRRNEPVHLSGAD
jgi:putative oxidoreductase